MSEIIHIDSYVPNSDDKFFLDTNIWMYLYCSIGNYDEFVVAKYNEFYEKILNSNAQIFTSALQISEFFNAYCRLEYNIAKRNNPHLHYKKHFRKSQEFKDLISYLKQIIQNRIFKNAIKLDDSFSTIDVGEIIKTGESFDFNDEYFVNMCLQDSILIVSNDRDLITHDSNIKVISNLN